MTEPGQLVSAVRVLDEEIDRMDRLASRFRQDSEVSRLHRGAGTRLVVSPELLELLESAVRVARATGGAVDPTVGGHSAGSATTATSSTSPAASTATCRTRIPSRGGGAW